MLPLASLSRRALIAAAALAAVPPSVQAKKKPKPKPPLAFVKATLVDFFNDAGNPGQVHFAFKGAAVHQASGKNFHLSGVTPVLTVLGEAGTRAAIAAHLQSLARYGFANHGVDVPADRIAVVLI